MFQLPPIHNKKNAGISINGDNCKSKLFTPIKIKNTVIKNRIFLAPMGQSSADSDDGKPNAYHLIHYGTLALRGAGLIMLETCAVKKEGRLGKNDIGLWNDNQIEAYKPIIDIIHFYGSVAGIQLSHGSKMYSDGNKKLLTELSKEEIKEIIKAFGEGAKRANQAGFDIVEFTVAFNFLSSILNQRTDEYGGSFENRIRFCIEVVKSIKENWSEEKPMFVRFSCSDWVENGWDAEQTVKLVRILQDMGVNFIDCSSKLSLSPSEPHYFILFAKEIKKHIPNILVGTAGFITSGKQAEEILQEGYADVVRIGRAFLVDPTLVLKWAEELGVEVEWPDQLLYGRESWHYQKKD